MTPDADRPGVAETPDRQDERASCVTLDATSPPPPPTRLRLLADPEPIAAELLERMGPAMAGAVAAALLSLLAGVTR